MMWLEAHLRSRPGCILHSCFVDEIFFTAPDLPPAGQRLRRMLGEDQGRTRVGRG